MSEADDLRKEVSKARERVTRKIARLRREKGVNVANSSYDPRQFSHNDMKSFSAGELRQVLHEYQQFTARNVQYVPLKGGTPLRAEVWKPIEQRIKAQKAKAAEIDADIGIVPHPVAGTIADQQAGKFKRDGADKGVGPYRAYDVDSNNFRSEEAARNWAKKNLTQFNQDTWEEEQTGFNREWLGKILTEMGEDATPYDELSDWQFTVLWYGTDFLTDKGYLYEIWKARNDKNQTDKSDPIDEKVANREIARAYRHVSENVPKTREETREKYTPKKKR
jgi:hypothetical protein